MQYRQEIDGLRALAVLPVIFFHAGVSWFAGGFVGVDVFFVISGYLITTILIDDIERKQFSLARFYERRARRILPALLVMLSVVFVVSSLIFLPGSHKVVGQYVVTSILSISNVLLYLKGNDYFGLEHASNPLFHTWSLGVEEQFYVVAPLLLYALWRTNRRWQLAIPLSIIAISLVVNAWMMHDTQFNFYMVFSRAWELGVGMLAAVVKRQGSVKPNASAALLGLLILLGSIVLIPSNHAFLSFLLILPVLGAGLIIVFSSGQDMVGRLLSNRICVSIGLVSYSLYLWHVPLWIFMNYLWEKNVYTLSSYYLLLALISYASYRFVERPYRTPASPSASSFQFVKLIVVPLGLTAVLMGLGVLGHVNGGFPNRSAFLARVQNNSGLGLRCNGNSEISTACATGQEPSVAVLGNSYAMMYVNALRREPNTALVQLTQDSCALGYVDVVQDVRALPCKTFYEKSVTTINQSQSIQTVILASPFIKEFTSTAYRESFNQLLADIGDKDIYVIGPTPKAPFSVGECLFKARLLKGSRSCDFEVDPSHGERVKAIADALSGYKQVNKRVHFLDVTGIICPQGRCTMSIGDDDSMYVDAGHLTVSGSSLVLKQLMPAMHLSSLSGKPDGE